MNGKPHQEVIEKKAVVAAKRGAKTTSSSSSSSADKVANGITVLYLSDRTCTGVLASHPLSCNIHIESLSLTFHGHDLIVDSELELNYGRRYGLLGLNGCGKSTLLTSIGCRELPILEHMDIYHLSSEIEASDMSALEAVICCDEEKIKLEKEPEILSAQDDGGGDALDRISPILKIMLWLEKLRCCHRDYTYYKNLQGAVLTYQCAQRQRLTGRELRKLKMAARETGALKEAKDKLEKRVEELTWRLGLKKRLKTDLEEAKGQEIAKLQETLHDMQQQVEEAKTMVIKEREGSRKAIESNRRSTSSNQRDPFESKHFCLI
ncbi:hypothetical protein GUJ93_ZPchr0004g38499 [Zizania palustris]|uniref:ABC transporter domain-containing protein n=1 Tax=Zizania palustris TaxID=103762 RepID=A0A8J5V8X9_ZIZPA|nr:hypothetical protein GUJ93_ZPchr0004g38499 [Zizania palustris]